MTPAPRFATVEGVNHTRSEADSDSPGESDGELLEQLDTMTDPFSSPKHRLARAKKHLADLKAEVDGFFLGEDPAEVVLEPNAGGTKNLHKFRFRKPLPAVTDDLAWDTVSNLRAALDNATFTCGVVAGNPDAKSAKFPFGDTAADVENDVRRGCKDLPQPIIALLMTFQPYKGGNDSLWALNKLCNIHKHRFLVPTVMVMGSTKGAGIGQGRVFSPEFDAGKYEFTFGESPPGGNLDYNVEMTMFVALDEPDIIRRKPAFDVLSAMAGEVERIVLATEAEARRIGLIS